jgi:dienelactone hydrolase
VYFPTDLGPPGARHPVVAWGNGSFEHPDKYEPLLRHLASWGCIVVAAETDQAGTGQELLAGARHVLAADLDPASALFGHVDHDHVAAVGHSQGAGGAMRAATDPSGIVTTVVAVALPAAVYQLLGTDHDFHATRLRVPALFLSGEADTLISPAGTVAGYYDEVPGAAAMGILRGADHNTIQLDAGSGFRGYVTAWLRWQLAGDATAGTAFTGPHPGLAADPAWADVRTKDLGAAPEPAPSPAAAPAPGPGPTAPTVAPPPGGPAASAPSAAAPSSEPPALPATGGGGVGPLVGVALAALALAARHPSWRHPGARPHAR